MHEHQLLLDDEQSTVVLSKIAASLGYTQAESADAGHKGDIGAMLRAVVRGELKMAVARTSQIQRPSYEQLYPERLKARCAIGNAVRRGKMPRVSTLYCEDCGAQARLYHHEDYNKPLQVVPLCSPCHGIRHTKRQP